MKLIPFAIIFAVAFFCSTIRNKIDPTPLPTLGDVPTPTRTASPSPAVEMPSGSPAANAVLVPGTISGGVLNGKAKSLPKPEYPAAARAARASGVVTVSVQVNETGSVDEAMATSGHPLLRQAAENAAMDATFEPTILSGKAVKVRGLLTYTFAP